MLMSIAVHESPRTTKLYDRTSYAISLDEIERIVLASLALDCAHARENAVARVRLRVIDGRLKIICLTVLRT